MNSLEFLEGLVKQYPDLDQAKSHFGSGQLASPFLISPQTVSLPWSVLSDARRIVSDIFNSSRLSEYQNLLPSLGIHRPQNQAIMMSYDFHLAENSKLKLIEINTNAAFLVLGSELEKMSSKKTFEFSAEDLKKCVEYETQQVWGEKPARRVVILDEIPESQKLYLEFLVAKEWFEEMSYEVRIENSLSFSPEPFDFIYNRDTDFYLNRPHHQKLRALYEENKIVLSPNPWEYHLLADKGRLENLRLFASLREAIPESFSLNSKPIDEIWQNRKKYFFKPKQAFGSKQSFRGASISRKAFEEMNPSETLAQEYIPAPEIQYEGQAYKYDLRAYAYRDQLQFMIARIYQGQVTNLRTPQGGFALVDFGS